MTIIKNPDDILEALCRKGKHISVGLEITDTKKAIEIMGTMYPVEGKPNDVGVRVYSWGNFDLVKGHENKEELLRAEVQRHRAHMDAIMELHLQTYCELERNEMNKLVFDVNDHIKPEY
jgi:hypothetical protein